MMGNLLVKALDILVGIKSVHPQNCIPKKSLYFRVEAMFIHQDASASNFLPRANVFEATRICHRSV